MINENFYTTLKSFKDYGNFLDNDNYQRVPSSWWILLTDVKNSTKAVAEGKFRDVNMVGALAITAVENAIKEKVPFVFGGDGSTILVPEHLKDRAIKCLQKAIYLSQEMYGLELRVGALPVSDVESEDSFIEVSKYELSEGNYIAQFRGGGLVVAESLVKANNSKYLLSSITESPDLTGLSCRWEPVQHNQGNILTVIVQNRTKNFELYSSMVKRIELILGHSLKESSPVRNDNLKVKFPPSTLHLEVKTVANKENYWKNYIRLWIVNAIAYIIVKNNIEIKTFSTKKYKKEMVLNSDYKKFDDSLRLVIDCTLDQKRQIESLLKNYEEECKVYFGTHSSSSAVLTCFVKTDQDHLHFIDGSDGGYTQAASQIKKKIKDIKYNFWLNENKARIVEIQKHKKLKHSS